LEDQDLEAAAAARRLLIFPAVLRAPRALRGV